MDIKRLSDDVSVTGQIAPGDIAAIKSAGYRSIVCNRPDGEASGQPAFRDVEAAAKSAGVEIRYLPVVPGKITPADGKAFASLMQQLPKPMLAYCRSGSRSTSLHALALSQGYRP